MTKGKDPGQVTFTSSGVRNSAASEHFSVGGAEGGEADRKRDDPHYPFEESSLSKDDSQRRLVQHILFGENSEVGHVHEQIAYHDERNSDYDGKRQVSLWVLKFLSQEIELVPAIVREESLIKCEREFEHVSLTAFESTSQCFSVAHDDFNKTDTDDENDGKYFGYGAICLNLKHTSIERGYKNDQNMQSVPFSY